MTTITRPIVLLAGALNTLSMAPFKHWPLGLLSAALFYWALKRAKTARNTLLAGLLYGLGYFASSISWTFVSVYEFGNTPLWFAALTTIALIGLLSCYFVGMAWCLFKSPLPSPHGSVCQFANFLILTEWLRSTLFTGFPWALLGQGQVNGPLMGLLPWIGLGGVSYCTAWIGAALAEKKWFMGSLLLGLGLLLSHSTWNWPEKTSLGFSASLVQGNVKPSVKFDPNFSPEQIYESMSQNLPSDLVIWPEAALTTLHPSDYSRAFLNHLDQAYKQRHATLILGLPVLENNRYYNTLLQLGISSGAYQKINLVPFGDFVPFEHFFRGLFGAFDLPLSSFSPGPANQEPLGIRIQNPSSAQPWHFQALPLICYEIIFPDWVQNQVRRHKPRLIVNISEDGWFGHSIGPKQHFEMAKIRAIENQVPVLRATSTGISALIEPTGQAHTLPPQTAAVLNTRVTLYEEKFPTFKALRPSFKQIALGALLLSLCLRYFLKNEPQKRLKQSA